MFAVFYISLAPLDHDRQTCSLLQWKVQCLTHLRYLGSFIAINSGSYYVFFSPGKKDTKWLWKVVVGMCEWCQNVWSKPENPLPSISRHVRFLFWLEPSVLLGDVRHLVLTRFSDWPLLMLLVNKNGKIKYKYTLCRRHYISKPGLC